MTTHCVARKWQDINGQGYAKPRIAQEDSEWGILIDKYIETRNEDRMGKDHERAFEELLLKYRKTIDWLASTYCYMGADPFETRRELAAVGAVAFWKNLERVAVRNGVEFSPSLCTKSVASQMLRHINRHTRAVSMPEDTVRLICRVRKEMSKDVTFDDAFESVVPETNNSLKNVVRNGLGFSAIEKKEIDDLALGCESGISVIYERDACRVINALIDGLPPLHKQAIQVYYGLHPHHRPHTFRESSKIMSLSRETIRIIVEDASKKIKQRMAKKALSFGAIMGG